MDVCVYASAGMHKDMRRDMCTRFVTGTGLLAITLDLLKERQHAFCASTQPEHACRATDVGATEEEHDWELLLSGRFAHSEAYVRRQSAASGFSVVAFERTVERVDRGSAVAGHLFIFRLDSLEPD